MKIIYPNDLITFIIYHSNPTYPARFKNKIKSSAAFLCKMYLALYKTVLRKGFFIYVREKLQGKREKRDYSFPTVLVEMVDLAMTFPNVKWMLVRFLSPTSRNWWFLDYFLIVADISCASFLCVQAKKKIFLILNIDQ